MHKNIKILLTCSILIHGGVNFLAPIYALYIKEIDGSLLDASATVGFYAVFRGILYFLLKNLDEKVYNKKLMIFAGYLLFGISYICYMFAGNITHVFIIQALLALAEVIITPSWSAVIATSLTKGQERSIYSDFYGYRSIFEGFSAVIGGILAFQLGFNVMFGLMAGLAFSAAALSLLLKKVEST